LYHISSFGKLNKFGFTRVPWFFVLSGSIPEQRRREKARKAAAALADAPPEESLLTYVIRRMETLYPLFLVGICASLATIWVIKGAAALPPPTEVLLSPLGVGAVRSGERASVPGAVLVPVLHALILDHLPPHLR
jgi:hypothetical protein